MPAVFKAPSTELLPKFHGKLPLHVPTKKRHPAEGAFFESTCPFWNKYAWLQATTILAGDFWLLDANSP